MAESPSTLADVESLVAAFDLVSTAIWIVNVEGVQKECTRLRSSGHHSVSSAIADDTALLARLESGIRLVAVNEAAVSMFGATDKDELVARWGEVVVDAQVESVIGFSEAIFRGGEAFNGVFAVRALSGREFSLHIRATIDHAAGHAVVSAIEMAERRRADQELGIVQTRYAVALRANRLGVWEWDLDTGACEYDGHYHRLLGFDREPSKRVDANFMSHVHPADATMAAARAAALRDGRSHELAFEARIRGNDGHYRWFAVRGQCGEGGQARRAVGTLRDITREYAAVSLAELEKRALNQVAHGDTTEAVLERVLRGVERVLPNYRLAYHLMREDGSAIASVVAPSLGPAYVDALIGMSIVNDCPCHEVMRTNRAVVIPDVNEEARCQNLRGVLAPFDVCGFASLPVSLVEATAFGALVVLSESRLSLSAHDHDVLRRARHIAAVILQREQRAKRDRLLTRQLQYQRHFENLGQLAGGVAHDFNNLLAAIVSHTELVGLLGKDRPEIVEGTERVLEATSVAADLCHEMLTYAGKVESGRSRVDLAALVDNIGGLVRSGAPRMIDIQTTVPEDLPEVWGNRSTLSQVFLNLLTNAREAVKESGRVALTCDVVELDEARVKKLKVGEALRDGPHVRVRITDDGVGIAPDVLERMFDPFFSTKAEGRGLGLTTVFGILTKHEAGLDVETSMRGTTVTVLLPTAPAKAEADRDEPTTTGPVAAASKRVLVVDDDEFVRNGLARLLRTEGFEVTCAPRGDAALELVANAPRSFDQVFVDQRMPGFTGLETYQRLREIDEELPVCFMTGFAATTELENIVRIDDRADLLRKPFDRGDLARVLAEREA